MQATEHWLIKVSFSFKKKGKHVFFSYGHCTYLEILHPRRKLMDEDMNIDLQISKHFILLPKHALLIIKVCKQVKITKYNK